jgi:O-6-methylguanine DNA methyltransferase
MPCLDLCFTAPIPIQARFVISAHGVKEVVLSMPKQVWQASSDELNAEQLSSFVKSYLQPWCQKWALGENGYIPLDMGQAERRLYEALNHVSVGTTVSYESFAQMLQLSGKACRYAGALLSKNRLPLIIPCHRVVRKNGAIGGYLFGQEIKKLLLNLETLFKK